MTETRGVAQIGARTEPLLIRLRMAESDNALGVVEMAFGPDDSGPPLHVHPNHGEGFYVISGEMTFQLGDEMITGGPGTWAYAPKETPHTLANLSDKEARILCVFAPGGFERRFERILAEQAGLPLPEKAPTEHGTRMIGPPLKPT